MGNGQDDRCAGCGAVRGKGGMCAGVVRVGIGKNGKVGSGQYSVWCAASGVRRCGKVAR